MTAQQPRKFVRDSEFSLKNRMKYVRTFISSIQVAVCEDGHIVGSGEFYTFSRDLYDITQDFDLVSNSNRVDRVLYALSVYYPWFEQFMRDRGWITDEGYIERSCSDHLGRWVAPFAPPAEEENS